MLISDLIPWLRSPQAKVTTMRIGARLPEPKPTIRVIMLETKAGSPDGVATVIYEAGREYDLPEDLAGCFFSTHSADPAEAHAQPLSGPHESQDGRDGSRGVRDGGKPIAARPRGRQGPKRA